MRHLNLRTRISVVAVLAIAFAMLAFPAAAHADHLTGGNWQVTFTQDGKMVDNYSEKEFVDSFAGMQPGDDITLRVNLNHAHSDSADWYMSNEVLKSLEGQVTSGAVYGTAAGSAYEYVLTYTGPAGGEPRVLYDSRRVGGDQSQGLFDATNALDDWLYLDTLSKGQTAHVDLNVLMDGETEGDAYFDTLAQLKMKFAVELTTQSSTPPTNSNRNIVVTGDSTDLFPFYVAMAVSGVLLLALGVASIRARRRDSEEVGR